MKQLIMFFILLVSVYAQESEALLPLQVGVQWVYRVELYDTSNDEVIGSWNDSLTVVATFQVADSLWYYMSDYSGLDSTYSEYFLGLFQGGCFRTTFEGEEALEPELFLPPTDRLYKFYENSEGKLYLNSINFPYSTPLGEFETFEFVLVKSGADETRIYVAPGTGIIAVEDLLDGIPSYRSLLIELRDEEI